MTVFESLYKKKKLESAAEFHAYGKLQVLIELSWFVMGLVSCCVYVLQSCDR